MYERSGTSTLSSAGAENALRSMFWFDEICYAEVGPDSFSLTTDEDCVADPLIGFFLW